MVPLCRNEHYVLSDWHLGNIAFRETDPASLVLIDWQGNEPAGAKQSICNSFQDALLDIVCQLCPERYRHCLIATCTAAKKVIANSFILYRQLILSDEYSFREKNLEITQSQCFTAFMLQCVKIEKLSCWSGRQFLRQAIFRSDTDIFRSDTF